MWETIDPAVLAVLPKQPLNGVSVYGTHPSGHEWSDSLRKLEQFRVEYTQDDWDGQGAPAISRELLDGAVALAKALQRHGVSGPNWTVPGMDVTVNFQWDLGKGSTVDIDLISPTTADVFAHSPGQPTESWAIGEGAPAR